MESTRVNGRPTLYLMQRLQGLFVLLHLVEVENVLNIELSYLKATLEKDTWPVTVSRLSSS